MFNEREMSKAIDWLFELFSPEDYEGYDEDEIGYAGGLCLPEVCTALRGAAQTVYQYSVAGGYEKCFNYCRKAVHLSWWYSWISKNGCYESPCAVTGGTVGNGWIQA